jgi:hypothetical protein
MFFLGFPRAAHLDAGRNASCLADHVKWFTLRRGAIDGGAQVRAAYSQWRFFCGCGRHGPERDGFLIGRPAQSQQMTPPARPRSIRTTAQATRTVEFRHATLPELLAVLRGFRRRWKNRCRVSRGDVDGRTVQQWRWNVPGRRLHLSEQLEFRDTIVDDLNADRRRLQRRRPDRLRLRPGDKILHAIEFS